MSADMSADLNPSQEETIPISSVLDDDDDCNKDDEDADDELFRNPLFQPLSQESKASFATSKAVAAEADAAIKQEKEELKALEEAREFANVAINGSGSWIVRDIEELNALQWHVLSRHNKSGRGKKRKSTKSLSPREQHQDPVLPCFILRNVNFAILDEHLQAQWKRFQTRSIPACVIKYLGIHHGRKQNFAVSSKQRLIPFNDDAGDDNGEASPNQNLTGTTTRPSAVTWSSSMMSRFLNSLIREQYSPAQVKAEEYYLQGMLDAVLDRDEQRKRLQEAQQKVVGVQEQDDVSFCESSDVVAEPLKLPSTETSTLGATSSTTEKSTILNAPHAEPSSEESPTDQLTSTDAVLKLRAGDVVQYFPPHLVASQGNIQEATVVNVFPRKGICLELSDGTRLTRDERVQLVKRRLHDRLCIVRNPTFAFLDKFKMDTRSNGKVINTFANQLDRMCKDAQDDIQQSFIDTFRSTSDTDECSNASTTSS